MRLRIGNATKGKTGILVYMNIGSWRTMQKVRAVLGRWLPDMPMWKSQSHWVPKSYFRNEFAWDGEYVLTLPFESEKDVASILRFK